MLDRIEFAAYSAYLKAQRKFNELKNKEDGMETLETIILVAVAVVVAILIVNILTKDGFTDSEGNKTGLVGWIFDQVKTKFTSILGSNDVRD